nr:hypothetical protein [bacterium]
PVLQPAWKYYSGSNYSSMSYNKPGLMLLTLQNMVGRETMNRILRTWLERWRFKHPRSADFIAVVNEVSGENFDWFFDQVLNSTAVLDYSVSEISSEEVEQNRGFDFFPADSTAAVSATATLTTDTVAAGGLESDTTGRRNKAGADSGKEVLDDKEKEEKKLYHSSVKVRRLGEFIFPVELQLIFSDGDTLIEKWDGRSRWKEFSVTRASRLVSAAIDPKNKILLDVQLTNNSRTLERSSRGKAKLAARILFWTQFFMDMPKFFNLFTIFSPHL